MSWEGALGPFLTHLQGPTAPTCLSVRLLPLGSFQRTQGLRKPWPGERTISGFQEKGLIFKSTAKKGKGVWGHDKSVYKCACLCACECGCVHTPVNACAHVCECRCVHTSVWVCGVCTCLCTHRSACTRRVHCTNTAENKHFCSQKYHSKT